MKYLVSGCQNLLHHRIGGLERLKPKRLQTQRLHHRIGGLEITKDMLIIFTILHHRIGGLETFGTIAKFV